MNIENHEHATTSLKVVLLVFAIVLVGALSYLVWASNTAPDTTDDSSAVVKKTTSSKTEATTTCDFATVNPTLKAAVAYDTMGEEEFDTVVCGYLVTAQENISFEGDPVVMKNKAYFMVSKFKDLQFKAALDADIAGGNTVNANSGGEYKLGCGCYENGKLSGDTSELTDALSLPKLLASTLSKPVIVKMSFYKEPGRGCSCCNLADKFEVL